MTHYVPPPLACVRVGCRLLPDGPYGLCRHHWLELAEAAYRMQDEQR